MATIVELQTKLTVDRSALTQGLSAAAGSVKEFGSTYKAELLVAATATAAFTAGFYILHKVVGEATTRISDLVDTATRLNVGTPELQRLQYAAKQSGIEIGTLNTALGKMQKTIGSAMDGSPAAVAALKSINLSVSDLSDLGADEQYIAIGEGLKSIINPAQQAAAAQAIFGRAGIEQLSLLKDNIKDLVNEYKGLGIELTGPQSAAIESYGDSVGKLDALWEGFKNQLAAALSGPLKKMVEWVANSTVQWGGLSEAALSTAESIVGGIDLTIKALEKLLNIQNEVSQNWKNVQLIFESNTLKRFPKDLDEIGSKIAKIIELQGNVSNGEARQGEGMLSGISAKLAELRKSIRDTPAGSVGEDVAIQKVVTSEYEKQVQRHKELNALADDRLKTEESLLGVLNGINSSQASLNSKRQELAAEQEKGNDNRFRGQSNEKLDLLEKQIKELEQSSGLNRANEATLQGLNKQVEMNPEFQSANILAQKLGQLGETLNKLSAKDSQQQNIRQQVEVKIDAGPGFIATVVNSTENTAKIIDTVNTSITEAARGEQR